MSAVLPLGARASTTAPCSSSHRTGYDFRGKEIFSHPCHSAITAASGLVVGLDRPSIFLSEVVRYRRQAGRAGFVHSVKAGQALIVQQAGQYLGGDSIQLGRQSAWADNLRTLPGGARYCFCGVGRFHFRPPLVNQRDGAAHHSASSRRLIAAVMLLPPARRGCQPQASPSGH